MVVGIIVLNEIIDVLIDEELFFDYEGDGEFYLILVIVVFMKRDLKIIVGFCEVLVLFYVIVSLDRIFE